VIQNKRIVLSSRRFWGSCLPAGPPVGGGGGLSVGYGGCDDTVGGGGRTADTASLPGPGRRYS
jgi:hypothetical protein